MLSRNLVRAADLVSSFKQVAVDQNNHTSGANFHWRRSFPRCRSSWRPAFENPMSS